MVNEICEKSHHHHATQGEDASPFDLGDVLLRNAKLLERGQGNRRETGHQKNLAVDEDGDKKKGERHTYYEMPPVVWD